MRKYLKMTDLIYTKKGAKVAVKYADFRHIFNYFKSFEEV